MKTKILANIVGFGVMAAVVGNRFVNGDRAIRQHEKLLYELHQVPAPQYTKFLGNAGWGFSVWNPQVITVGSSYRIRVSPEELLAHYNERMRSLGWRFEHPIVVRDWWRDEGDRKQVYCKDDLEANLTYGPDGEYFFSVHWEEGIGAFLRRLVGLPQVPLKDCWRNPVETP